MARLSETTALQRIRELLEDIFASTSEIRLLQSDVDTVVELPPYKFIVEFKETSTRAAIQRGIEQLKRTSTDTNSIHLLVVPFMIESGKQQCMSASMSWLDLSGNASIRHEQIVISIEGKQNKYKRPGRPRNPFSIKSSRIVRVLLSCPHESLHQSELVARARVSKALVSQVVSTLIQEGFLERRTGKGIRVLDPGLLLDEWQQRYSFADHRVTRGHVYSNGEGPKRVKDLAHRLSRLGVEYAFTGLAAAWHYAPFANFRLASLYTRAPLTPNEIEDLGFIPEHKGANVWLAEPNDEGVFWDSVRHEGVVFASAIQTYLDLKDQPERSNDAIGELKSTLFQTPENAQQASVH